MKLNEIIEKQIRYLLDLYFENPISVQVTNIIHELITFYYQEEEIFKWFLAEIIKNEKNINKKIQLLTLLQYIFDFELEKYIKDMVMEDLLDNQIITEKDAFDFFRDCGRYEDVIFTVLLDFLESESSSGSDTIKEKVKEIKKFLHSSLVNYIEIASEENDEDIEY